MFKEYDSKDIIFIVADSKNDSVSKYSLLTKEYFDKIKLQNRMTLLLVIAVRELNLLLVKTE